MSRDYIPSTMGLTTTISSNLGEVNSEELIFHWIIIKPLTQD